MNSQLNCAYAENVKEQKYSVLKAISEIISEIQSSKYQNLVNQIQSANNDDLSKNLKLALPVFYPTLISINTKMPTGIIQFDIDLKNNLDVDMVMLACEIKKLPYLLYLFKSPRNGLKFGILTDFSNQFNQNESQLKESFKNCYQLVLEQLYEEVKIPFEADKSVQSINQACFYSHDSEAYFNEAPEILAVQDIIIHYLSEQNAKPSTHKSVNTHNSVEFIMELLGFIPRDYTYIDRLPINVCVCVLLGLDEGLRVLVSHWHKPQAKLENQIDSQYKYCKNSNIGVLINAAKNHDYKITTGKARNKLLPKLSSTKLPDLSNQEEATNKLNTIIDNFFFGHKQNTYVSVTVGAGKTKAVIETLAKPSFSGVNILYLVRDHKLGNQIEQDLKAEIMRHKSTFVGFSREKFAYKNSVIRIKGKTQPICDDTELTMECFGNFYGFDEITESCPYTEQYESHANIRIMTHNEWFNQPSKWSNRINYTLTPSYMLPNGDLVESCTISPSNDSSYWNPEFIVIDEDIISIDDEIINKTEDINCKYGSIKKVINSLKLGGILEDALKTYADKISDDNENNPNWLGRGKNGVKNKGYSEVLNSFDRYLKTEQVNCLNGIYYKDEKLHINRLKQTHNRYQNVPTLILDATAEPSVIQKVYPDFSFHNIKIKSNSDVNVYQMQNANFTKKYLQDAEKRRTVVKGLKDIVNQYSNVGLISYKKIEGDDDFTKKIADEIGIKRYAHFGNLRGCNDFEDVDCLLILGRCAIPVDEYKLYADAIYGSKDYNDNKVYVDKLIRMKNGNVCTLNNQIYLNSELESIYTYKSIGETIQAVGRGRLIHGKKKDIFLFSSESLGTDIEITDLFRYEDLFEKLIFDDNTQEYLRSFEMIETSNKSLTTLLEKAGFQSNGALKNFVKHNKKEILAEIENLGFICHSIKKKILVNHTFIAKLELLN